MLTHSITRTWTGSSGIISAQVSTQASGELSYDAPIPEDDTTPIAIAFLAAKVKSFFALAAGPLTLECKDNSNATANTIELEAGGAFTWVDADGPFSDTTGASMDNIASIDVVNPSETETLLQLRILIDAD